MSLIKSVSGVRGIARGDRPEEVTLNADVVRRLGKAYATHLVRTGPGGWQVVVSGRDGRAGGEELLAAFADGARACGVEVLDLGIVTTPGVALTARAAGAAGGVVITASHNPAQWNGVKFLTREGRAPAKAEAEAIFRIFDQGDYHDDPLRRRTSPMKLDPHVHHVDAVLELVNTERIRRRRFTVVLDSINGAGAKVGRMLLERLGCTVHHLNAEPAATFAHPPEPILENLTNLCDKVRAAGADIGFAQDPDADRVAIVDEAGRYVGEEYSLALAARQAFRAKRGPAATNLSTSRLVDDVAAAAGEGCSVYRTPVGEANVVDGMKAHHCVIGGEGNGGVIHPKVVHVRDSLVGMALVLDLLAAEERSLSDVVGELPAYAMIKEKVRCEQDRINHVLATVRQAFADAEINDMDGIRADWPAERKWVHVRGSNTEPIMRLIVEAPDAASAEDLMGKIRTHLQSAD